MTPLSKWIDGLAPEDSVSDACRRSLEDRLATVAYWLPLAARQINDDTEKVHQLRVSTRRAIAALKLYRDWLPRRPRRWLKQRLTQARQAAGAARDLDVLMKWMRQELENDANEHHNDDELGEVLQTAARERDEAQQPIEAVAKKCGKNNRLGRTTSDLLARVTPRGKAAEAFDDSFRDWAVTRLGRAAQQFFKSQPADANDLAELHQFRIRGKELRYTIELLAPAFGPHLRKECYPTVEKLQELLGDVNDCVAGAAQLRKWHQDAKSPEVRQQFEQLIERQRQALDEGIDKYGAWWTAERAETLRRGLATAGDEHEVKTSVPLPSEFVAEGHG